MKEFHDLNPAIMSNSEATRREDLSAFFAFTDKEIGDMAVRALLYEVSATPKPGLVDRANNGAHKDMCFETFLDSAAALRGCFEECAAAGREWKSNQNLAVSLRNIGIAGEKEMFKATKGVNTHKGLIFSLGILSCAASMKASGHEGSLQEICQVMAEKIFQDKDKEKEYSAGAADMGEKTHGELVMEKTGIRGIRAEALSGFESAFSIGLPELVKAREEGCSMNVAMVRTLIKLIAVCEDSNVVYRGGTEGLEFMQKKAKMILDSSPDWWEDENLKVIKEFDQECIVKNLSPGGCADLLAITVMIYFVNTNSKKRG